MMRHWVSIVSFSCILVYITQGKPSKVDGQCFEKKQSPINIVRRSSIYSHSLAKYPLVLEGFDSEALGDFHVENNGHTVQASMQDTDNKFISGGNLQSKYRLLQFHFHWGGDDEVGSEHTIDGKRYPLEMHLVFLREDIKDFKDIDSSPDSVTVLGVIFEVGDEVNRDYEVLTKKIRGVEFKDDKHKMAKVNIGSLLPNHDHFLTNISDYYTYAGSLTTPPCNQVVVWNIISRTVKLSASQVEVFRTLKTGTKQSYGNSTIGSNFRELQDLNGRSVQRSFEPYGFAKEIKKKIETKIKTKPNEPNEASHYAGIPILVGVFSLTSVLLAL